MEYLDDELDDLFRRAGENYPLKTTDSDWDAVLGRLQSRSDSGQTGGSETGGSKNRKNRLLWLLLLIPFTLAGVEYFSRSDKKPNPTAVAPDRTTKQAGNAGNSMSGNSRTGSSATEAGNSSSLNQPQTQSVIRYPEATSVNIPPARSLPVSPDRQAAGETRMQSGSENNSITKTPAGPPEAGDNGIPESAAESAPLSGQATTEDHENPTKKVTDPDAQSAQPAKQETAAAPAEKKSVSPAAKEKGIYLSLLGGPDLSSVKFQSVKNVGYSIGLLVGYRLNRHWSVETGVFWDKKQYYSDGEYFDKSKTDIPAAVEIKDIDGNCNMFEIPVTARYDFSFTRKGRFFATAGLSSYLMKKENYVYTANGYAPGWSHAVSYENSGNNLFSILQLSAGYEYKLGKNILIRAEPYFSIPLSGVGIGSLPLSSAGLHLGITVPLKK